MQALDLTRGAVRSWHEVQVYSHRLTENIEYGLSSLGNRECTHTAHVDRIDSSDSLSYLLRVLVASQSDHDYEHNPGLVKKKAMNYIPDKSRFPLNSRELDGESFLV